MKKAIFITAIAIAALSNHNAAQAELIKDGIWKISAGDNIDSILQSVLPNDKHRHPRLKKLATRLNKKAFAADGQLIAGKTLRLPGTKMPDQTPVNSKKIGRVLISNGQLAAKQKDGSSRSLKRGSSIYEGDTVETKTGRSQLRFSDGSLVALRPNTAFKVEEYNYAGQQDGSEKGVYNLLRGGFRTISGAIGKLNKSNYKVKTPVATIGIRGTHYGLTVCDAGSCRANGLDDGLYGGVVDGSIVTNNSSGESTFNNDEYFSIASIDAKPQSLLAPPGVIFGQSKPTKQSAEKSAKKGEQKQPKKNKKRLLNNPNARQQMSENITRQRRQADPDLRINPELIIKIKEFVDNDPTLTQFFAPGTNTLPSRQGTQAPSNARIHASFLGTQAGKDIQVAFQLGQPNSTGNNAETGVIFTDTVNGHASIPTYFGFTDTENNSPIPVTREFFASSPSDLKEVGGIAALNLRWGRWDNALTTETKNIGGQDVTVKVPTKDIHFMYTENNVLNAAQLQAIVANSGTVNLSYSGGTNPTDLQGNVGVINPLYTTAELNMEMGTGKLSQFTIKSEFGPSGSAEHYYLEMAPEDPSDPTSLPGPVKFSDIIGKGGAISLTGNCSNAGACANSIPITGNASADFIANGNQLYMISSFSAHDGNENTGAAATVGVAGTALFSGGG